MALPRILQVTEWKAEQPRLPTSMLASRVEDQLFRTVTQAAGIQAARLHTGTKGWQHLELMHWAPLRAWGRAEKGIGHLDLRGTGAAGSL